MSEIELLCGYIACILIAAAIMTVAYFILCAVGSGTDAHLQE